MKAWALYFFVILCLIAQQELLLVLYLENAKVVPELLRMYSEKAQVVLIKLDLIHSNCHSIVYTVRNQSS